jgi:hypothetical protein
LRGREKRQEETTESISSTFSSNQLKKKKRVNLFLKKIKAMPQPPTKKRKKYKKIEVVFDQEARKAHLRGFSDRKKQRRAYGLAMQKIKDRKAKIEQRKQEKKDSLERVEEAERQKLELLEEAMLNNKTLKDVDSDTEKDEDSQKEEDSKQHSCISKKQYNDKQSEKKWGGSVTVTTSFVSLDDDDDDDDDDESDNDTRNQRGRAKSKKSIDKQQRYAGNVEKYISQLKGNLPGKKKHQANSGKRKGKSGMAEMRGMGGSSNLKMAQKVLAKTKAKNGRGGSGGEKKSKGKRSRR